MLIGSEDISKLDLYSEGDPRVLDLNGALNVGNRGMVEFIEVFKNETEYLHGMITATQEKVIPAPGRHGMVYVDTVIVAHSNEAEWQKFKADHTNEAILDRIVVVKVPYNLRLSEEVKIYQKIIRNSDFRAHVAPHTLEIASMFAILSRLEPTAKCDLMTKLKLYNGEEVVEKGKTKKIDVQELREDAKREGMSGISTRFIMKALDNALSDNVDGNCINPINVREALINMVKEADLPDDTRKQYLEFLQDMLHKEYLEMLEKEITKAFVYSYQEQAESLFQNYLDHAEAYVNKTKVKDRNTKEELQPDEGFLKSIEEQIAIIGSAADGFRQEVIAYLWAASRRGERITYRSYEPLKEAIEKKLMTSVRDISRIITKARTRDEEQTGEVQRDGEEPARQRLLRELRRRRPQVRRQQPLEGLRTRTDRARHRVTARSTMSTIFRPFPSSGQRSDRSAGDRLRHRQKVRESIRDNIADIIAEESIIGKDRDRSSRSRSAASGSTASSTATMRPASARRRRQPAARPGRRQGKDGKGGQTRPATGRASTTTRPTSRSKS